MKTNKSEFFGRKLFRADDLTSSDEEVGVLDNRVEVDSLDEANLVSSKLSNGKHAPVLDLDIPHALVPSSTEGHSHLYLDIEIWWDDYVELLKVMSKCGILEEPYVRLNIERGATFVRKPGLIKGDDQ